MTYLELARRRKKWSQHQLSDLTQVQQAFISMIERGRGIPSPEERARLARALDIPEDLLLKDVPDLVESPASVEALTR
jgi:transcriptional regulator with XRE-family HTH domain